MRWLIALLLLLAIVGGAIALVFSPRVEPVTVVPDPNVKRGAYLARISGCVACHTNGTNGEPLAGGVALKSKFGTFFSPNITPDAEFGIGEWSVDEFAAALRHGVSPDGRPYYPAFPYPFYAALNDRDVADLWAAIRIVPPSTMRSIPHQVGFPFNIRAGLHLWRRLFPPSEFEEDPTRSASWNRGKLIAEGPAHCGACHTPRNIAGARIVDRKFLGDPAMLDGGASPAIDAASLREAGWTKAGLVRALRTGVTPGGDVLGGSMAEVIEDGTAYMMGTHLEDLATFLLDEP